MKKLFIPVLIILTLFRFQSNAQIVSGNAFLKGTFIEVGVGPCGSFGTSVNTPAGYHQRGECPSRSGQITYNRLGFVADYGMDGFTVGSPAYHGDFFVPGSPEEGWGIKFNGTSRNNNQLCDVNNVPGSLSGYSTSGGVLSVNWDGSTAGVNISKTTFFPANASYFVTRVLITNTTAAAVNNVYYMRNLDPDNDEPITCDYTTINTIVSQPNAGNNYQALVQARGTVYATAFVALGTLDSRAHVTTGGFSNRDPQAIYTGVGSGLLSSGTRTADEAISLGFSLGNLAPGQSVCFAYAYVLNPSDLTAALQSTSAPSFFANGTDITATGTYTTCSNTPVTIQIAGGNQFTWAWTPATNLSPTTGSSVVMTPGSSTTYTVDGVSPCESFSKTITINVVDPELANAGPDQTVASSGTTMGAIAPSVGVGTWSVVSGTGNFVDIHDPLSAVSGLSSGSNIFRWTIVSPPPCSDDDDVEITFTDCIAPHITCPDNLVFNNSCGLNKSYGADVTGTNPNVTFSPASGSFFGVGTTTVTATASNACGSESCQFTITVNPPALSCNASSPILGNCGTNIRCNGGTGSAAATATGGCSPYSFVWSNSSTGSSIGGLSAGTYSVVVTDGNGTTSSCSVTLTEPSALTATASSTNPLIFFGYSADQKAPITVTSSGGCGARTNLWSMSRGLNCNVTNATGDEQLLDGWNKTCTCSGTNCSTPVSTYTGTSFSAILTSDANFTVVVTDANSCTTSSTVHIDAIDSRCFAGSSGNAKVQVCHHTGSATNPYVQICVSENAVAELLSLGDCIGPCNAYSNPINCTGYRMVSLDENAGSDAFRVYPNPFNDKTTVSFTVPTEGKTVVRIFDALGQEVTVLFNGIAKAATEYKVEFDGSVYPAGIYFYSITSDEMNQTMRMQLIK